MILQYEHMIFIRISGLDHKKILFEFLDLG